MIHLLYNANTAWPGAGTQELWDLSCITGITGTREAAASDVAPHVARIKKCTDLPVCVGFGIRTPEQAADIARIADGAVVGSVLVDIVAANVDAPDLPEKVLELVRKLAAGVRSARN